MFKLMMSTTLCLMLSVASYAADNTTRTQPLKLAPVKPQTMKMHTVATDNKPAGFHLLATSWSPGGHAGVERLNLHLYNKMQELHKNAKVTVTYYSSIEQRWVMAGGGRPLGDIAPMQKGWKNGIDVKKRQSQFSKMKIEIQADIDGEPLPGPPGGPLYITTKKLKEMVIPL